MNIKIMLKQNIFFKIIIFLLLHSKVIYSQKTISFLNKLKHPNSILTNNSFWYLEFFRSPEFLELTGKNIQIVVIDSELRKKNSFRINKSKISKNLNQEERFNLCLTTNQKNKNLSSWLTKKDFKLEKIIQKNHAEITVDLISQIAPEAKITVIPVLNEHGSGSKSDLYQGLEKALTMNPDILHLGLQITDFNLKLALDKKILKILKKFKCVVAPSGNKGKDEKVGFPANYPFVISVGSFKQDTLASFSWPERVVQGHASKDLVKIDRYKVSDFCQIEGGVDIIMPGENLLAQIWIEMLEDYFCIPVSGTSMAAALMTGQIACLLERYSQNKNLKKIIIKNYKIKLPVLLNR